MSPPRHAGRVRVLSPGPRRVAPVTDEERRFLGTSEVADLLHVTPKTVQRRANTGEIPIVGRLGKQGEYVFDADVIERIAEQENP